MLTTERRKVIFTKIDAYIRAGGISPFIARANGQLPAVAKKIDVPEAELSEHLAMLDRELPAVGDY